MPKRNYIVVSLKDEKTKKLASTISNKTCRKILEYLENKKDAAENEIAKDLKLPISTVHYSLNLLKENNLIKIKDFVWSDKGKKVNLYEAVKKLIIINPTYTKEFKNQLKGILSITVLGIIFSALIHLYQKTLYKIEATPLYEKTEAITPASTQITQHPNYALWFLSGILFTSILYIIYIFIKNKASK